MMRPTHTAFTAAATLGVLNVAEPAIPAGVLFATVAMSTVMLPDSLEKVGFGHRQTTHKLWMAALVVVFVTWLAVHIEPLAPYVLWIAGGLAVGYGMHLFADGLTRTGLPMPWLLRKLLGREPGKGEDAPRLHLLPKWLRPHTGRLSELPYRLAAMAACVVFTWTLLPVAWQNTAERLGKGVERALTNQPAHTNR